MRVVLHVEDAVTGVPSAVGLGIAPAVEQIAVWTGCLLSGGAVVDDVEFVPIARVENKVVQLGIVAHRIAVEPIAPTRPAGEAAAVDLSVIHIEPGDLLCRVAEIGQGRIGVLDEVVPGVPFPDHLPSIAAFGLDLIEHRRPERPFGLTAREGGFGGADVFPAEHDHVAVGQVCHVVVVVGRIARDFETPDEVTFPGEALDAPAHAATGEEIALQPARPEQGTVLQEIGRFPGAVFAVPLVDDAAAVVNQVRSRCAAWRHKGVTIVSLRGIQEQTDGLPLEEDGR